MSLLLPHPRLSNSLGGGHPHSHAVERGTRPVDVAGLVTSSLPDASQSLTQVRHLLELIAGEKCRKVTGGARCWTDPGSTPNFPWGADRWCDACIAQVALDALNSSLPVTRSGGEAASPVAGYVTAHAVAGDASNVPTPKVGDGPPE